MQSKQRRLDCFVESKRGLKIKKAIIVLSELYNCIAASKFNEAYKKFYIESNPMFDMQSLFAMLDESGVEDIMLSIYTKAGVHSLMVIRALVSNRLPKYLQIALQGYAANGMLHSLANKLAVSKEIRSLILSFGWSEGFVDMSIIDRAVLHNENIIKASYPGMDDYVSNVLSERAAAQEEYEDLQDERNEMLDCSVMMTPCPLLDSFKLNFGCTVVSSRVSGKDLKIDSHSVNSNNKSIHNSSVSDFFEKGLLEYRSSVSGTAIQQASTNSNYMVPIFHHVYYAQYMVPAYYHINYAAMASNNYYSYM